jgi:phosphodiester glycosidase
LVLLAAVTVPLWSFASSVMVSNGDPFSVNATEWARSHYLSWLVDRAEHSWYAHHQPPKGGSPRGGIARVAPAPVAVHVVQHHGRRAGADSVASCPRTIRPLAAGTLAGEGVWQPAGRAPGVVCFAYLRPDPVHTSVIIGVAWMNMHALSATLHNGTSLPGGGPWRAGPMISPNDYARVAAAFNGGFRLDASRGGYFTEGRTVRPLVGGRASLVIFADGHVDIGLWGRDAVMSANVASVRQNLDLIVDNGQLVSGLSDANNSRWGATLGNLIYTWRSGVGIDARGNLVYVAGPGLNVDTLATVLQHAGCIRAMELDINPEWTTLMVYRPGSSALAASKLLTNMQRPADRYLHSGTRDFIELDLRH